MLKKRGFTLVEILITSFVLVLLLASAVGVFMFVDTFSSSTIAGQNLQRDINTVMGKIVHGMKEQNGIFGLRSAQGFTIPVITEIDFKGTDTPTPNWRKYYVLNGSLIYTSPTASPNTQTVYTPPANSTMTLRFWSDPLGDSEKVGIYISVRQSTGGKTVSGSLSTYVNLRNVWRS